MSSGTLTHEMLVNNSTSSISESSSFIELERITPIQTSSFNTIEILFNNFNWDSVSTTAIVKDTLPEYKHVIESLPWAYGFYTSAKNLTKSSQLVPYYTEINKIISEQNFDDCNSFLSYAVPKHMSDVLLVGLLRLTFKNQNNLTSWLPLREQVKKELFSRGYDADRKLRGLL